MVLKERYIPFFYVRPIDAINEFAIDNIFRTMRIKHDVKTGSGKFFDCFFSYKSERRYVALFGETVNIFLYPPNADRDFWILKIEENKKGGENNGNRKMD